MRLRLGGPIALASILVLGATAGAEPLRLQAPQLDRRVARQLAAQHDLIKEHVLLRRRLQPSKMVPISASAGLRLTKMAGQLSFEIAQKRATITNQLTFQATAPGVGSIYVVVEAMQDGSFTVSDAQGPLTLADQGNGIYLLTFRQALAMGEQLELSSTRGGVPQCQAQFLSLVTCQIAPEHIFVVGNAWQPSFYTANSELVSPELASIDVVVPATMKVAATGIAAGEIDNGDGNKTFSFVNEYSGNFSVAAAPYDVGSRSFGVGKSAGTFLLPAQAPFAAGWRQVVADVITFHAERYGSYDPPKIDIAQIPDVTSAAYGPMLTVFMPTATVSYDPANWATHSTLAHELGHQWFGGFIQQEGGSPWLSEGFASFAEMLYTASKATPALGYEYLPYLRRAQTLTYLYAMPSGEDVPISSPGIYQVSSEAYVVLTYVKGAMVPSMLRYRVGDDNAFFQAIRDYRADHQDTLASVAGLAGSIKASSGVEVGAMLSFWAHEAGYPTYKTAVTRERNDAGKHLTEITITSDRAAGVPVEVELFLADESKQRVRLPLSAANAQTFTHQATTDAEVVHVRVDPDFQLVARKLGALAGDIRVDGEIDGTDLIYAASAVGSTFDRMTFYTEGFAEWADLVFDGKVDQQDLDVVLDNFGKRNGE